MPNSKPKMESVYKVMQITTDKKNSLAIMLAIHSKVIPIDFAMIRNDSRVKFMCEGSFTKCKNYCAPVAMNDSKLSQGGGLICYCK